MGVCGAGVQDEPELSSESKKCSNDRDTPEGHGAGVKTQTGQIGVSVNIKFNGHREQDALAAH